MNSDYYYLGAPHLGTFRLDASITLLFATCPPGLDKTGIQLPVDVSQPLRAFPVSPPAAPCRGAEPDQAEARPGQDRHAPTSGGAAAPQAPAGRRGHCPSTFHLRPQHNERELPLDFPGRRLCLSSQRRRSSEAGHRARCHGAPRDERQRGLGCILG